MSVISVFLMALDKMSVMGNQTASTIAANDPAKLDRNAITKMGSHTNPGTGPMILSSGDSQ